MRHDKARVEQYLLHEATRPGILCLTEHNAKAKCYSSRHSAQGECHCSEGIRELHRCVPVTRMPVVVMLLGQRL